MSALAVAGSAEAGPWAQRQGDIYARVNLSAERLDGEDGRRADLYGEYGLGGGWMVTGKAESVRYYGGTQDRDAYASPHGTTLAGVFGCQGAGGEARVSAGRSGVCKTRNYYLFADAAWIHQEGGCDRQRFEFGYGSDLGGNFFTTEQVWLEYGRQSANSIKTETQIGYHFPAADVSVG